jgi:histidyl-tRNA synthetase
MRDLTGPDLEAIEAAAAVCRELFARRGYSRIETPLLEESELFLRKSGGELASRLYSFTEPGGHPVALRPEYTAPALRFVIENNAFSALPLRVQYCGPVFRHMPPTQGAAASPAQFTQLGAEIIGAPAPMADGEVISLAWGGLSALGVRSPRVVIGHVGLIWDLLKPYGLSERARLFLINSVGILRDGRTGAEAIRAKAVELGLIPGDGGRPARSAGFNDEESLTLVESVLGETLGEPVARSAGTRTASEIVSRLARKLTIADDPQKFGAALDLVTEIAIINGAVEKALASGRKTAARFSRDGSVFGQVEEIVTAAADEGVPPEAVAVDFGLARGIAYYTGMVFDLFAGAGTAERPLGGGGRYDGLTRALGADRDAPALGFAYNLDAVAAAMPGRTRMPAQVLLVVPAEKSAARAASTYAARLRERGETAILEVQRRSRAERARFARAAGVRKVITVSASGRISEEAV